MFKSESPIFVVALLFIATISMNMNAQGKLSAGLSAQLINTRLVVNVSSLNAKGAYRPGTTLFVEYDMGKNMALHTGLGYTMMTQNSDAFTNDFHYLAVPLHLKFGRLKAGKRFAFTTFVGTDLHYLLSARHNFLDGGEKNIIDQARQFHFDLVVGGGIKFRLSEQLSLEPQASFSFGYNINKYNAAYLDINNINIGYMLNLTYKF
jgi:hypothetical protein